MTIRFDQTDVASLSDAHLKALAGMYFQVHAEGGPLATFAHDMSMALIGASRQRHALWVRSAADFEDTSSNVGIFLGDGTDTSDDDGEAQ